MPSSVIRRFDYSRDTRTLRVTFISGAIYDYFNVPPHVADAFSAAPSKGEFFGKLVRPVFQFEKVRDARDDGAGRWASR
jgi:hypothetical protein